MQFPNHRLEKKTISGASANDLTSLECTYFILELRLLVFKFVDLSADRLASDKFGAIKNITPNFEKKCTILVRRGHAQGR